MAAELITSTKYIEIYFDEEKSFYFWKFLPASIELTVDQIKDTISLIFDTLYDYEPDFVMANDTDNRGVFSPIIQPWVVKVTTDAFKSCDVKKFAVVLPTSNEENKATKDIMRANKKMVLKTVYNSFDNLDDAKKWLFEN